MECFLMIVDKNCEQLTKLLRLKKDGFKRPSLIMWNVWFPWKVKLELSETMADKLYLIYSSSSAVPVQAFIRNLNIFGL